jgi:murein DD-endopeptidase MepM/ murein hydrolase activator NlpD
MSPFLITLQRFGKIHFEGLMTIRIFIVLFTVIMFGCSSNPNLNNLIAGTGGGLADIKIAEFGRAPAKTPQSSLVDKPASGSVIGKYDFSVEEVQFRESSFLANGKQAPSVRLVAKNRGYAPVSVIVTFDRDISENMTWDATKAHNSVVPPQSEKEVARFDPINNRSHWKLFWHYAWNIGDYTAHHMTPQGYRFPFSDSVSAYAGVSEDANSGPYARNAVMFSMPADASVLAARKGTVVRINEKNDLDILHDDSTIATYSHLGEIARGIGVGKAVEAGDPLGFAGKTTEGAFMQLAVWRPEPKAIATLENNDKSGFQAVSFPLEFCTDAQHCMVLKRSQPVSFAAAPPCAVNKTAAPPVALNKIAVKSETGDYDFSLSDDLSAKPSSMPDTPASSRIIAVNRGYATVSVIVDLNPHSTENITSDVSLPHTAVIPPKTEKVLARLFPIDTGKRMGYSFRYFWQLGDLTTHHQCPEHYRFPFANNVRASAQIPDQQDSDPFTRYSVQFSLPVESKVLAARNGVVVRVKNNNSIDISHNDSTIATYNHLGKVEKGIHAGKPVSAGEVLGVAGESENPGNAYMQITVWRPEIPSSDTLRKDAAANFQPISFPLEFCSESGNCRVLTHNQQISVKSPGKKKL